MNDRSESAWQNMNFAKGKFTQMSQMSPPNENVSESAFSFVNHKSIQFLLFKWCFRTAL